MAVERVEKRLRRVTEALDRAGIQYAVIGGNAVAAWVSRVDPEATRSTKDVDLLVEQRDLDRVTQVMQSISFRRADTMGLVLFLDPEEPSVRSGVHLVWAGQPVKPEYAHAAPELAESERDPLGFAVVGLHALVRMKLTSFRRIDQVHIQDMMGVGLIDAQVRQSLSEQLRERLDQLARTMDEP